MQPLQTQPHRLRTRLVVALPVHGATPLGHPPNQLLELRRVFGRLLAPHHLVHRLPFPRLEHRLATDLRAAPAQPTDGPRPPRHDPVYWVYPRAR